MSSIDPKHIAAVGRVLMGGGEACEGSVSDAHALLESTDPAVHAAMLDALTRHGVLHGERQIQREPWAMMRRLVSRWEVTP